jgi:hypothetical protein
MTEEIEVDRLLSSCADALHLLAPLLCIEHGAWKRPECAAFRGLGHKLPVDRARHGRLHDGKLDAKKLDQSAIGPHRYKLSTVGLMPVHKHVSSLRAS